MQLSDVVVCLHVLLDRALKSRGYEEILLFEAQLFALYVVVAGIKDVADRAGEVFLLDGFLVFASVKRVKFEAHYRLSVPDSQSINKTVAVTDDRQVIRDRLDSAVAFLLVHGAAVSVKIRGDISAEVHFLRILGSSELERIAVLKPVIGHFYLIAVPDLLLEHAVLVADARAVCRVIQGSKRIQKACCQSSETAVSERRIGFLVLDRVEFESELLECLFDRLIRHQVDGVIAEGTAHKEFHGEIDKFLGILVVKRLLSTHPAVDDLVLEGQSGSLEHLLLRCFLHSAAVHCAYIVLYTSLEKVFVKFNSRSFYHKISSFRSINPDRAVSVPVSVTSAMLLRGYHGTVFPGAGLL